MIDIILNFVTSHPVEANVIAFLFGFYIFYSVPKIVKGIKIFLIYDELNEECKREQEKVYHQHLAEEFDTDECLDKMVWLGQLYSEIMEDVKDSYLKKARKAKVRT